MKMDLGNWQVAGNATRDGKPLAIETRSIAKRFDGFTVVDGIDITVPEGAIYGILGPNGAGKTTTLIILLGIDISRLKPILEGEVGIRY
jgi:ABC-2 type transport system ATP-binding protein